MICTFFGYKDAPQSVYVPLKAAIIKLIEEENADTFYVGNQGSFDRMAYSVMKKLAPSYPDIRYSVVPAYIPTEKGNMNYPDSLVPEGIETVPKRFAIRFRNKWMIDKADIVVAYVVHSYGGAAKFVEMAERKGKRTIRLK